MRELKLKYIIELVSDISRKAKTDEIALSQAQKKIQQELVETNTQLGRMERLLLKVGGVGSASAERQAAYLSKLALRYQDVRRAAEGASNAMNKVAAVGAGVAAGAMATERLTRGPMEYSLRLAHMTNTAYAGRDAEGWKSGKRTLDSAISASVRVGGGTRDDAAGALDTLIASGAMPVDQAIKMLPMLMRASSASGADATALGNIGIRAMQSFKLGVGDVPQALDMAMAAGQAGGFELKDMARWLPQAMAAGSQSGLSGIEGYRRILASMQASVITAGTKDQAGNNVVNLLGKINSKDTAADFHKLGIDLPAELANARSKGTNSLDAFIGLVQQVVSKDPRYAAVQAQLAKEGNTGGETEATLAMQSIFQGAGMGSVVQDQQAMMALVAEMKNPSYVASVMDQTRKSTGVTSTAFERISGEASYKFDSAKAEVLNAAQTAFEKITPVVNLLLDGVTKTAREFPGLTVGVVGAAGALGVLTTALGASGLIGLLTGKAGGAGIAGTLLGGGLAMAAKGAGVVGAGAFAGYEVWQLGGALSQLYEASNRTERGNGVVLSDDAKRRLGMPVARDRERAAYGAYFRSNGMPGIDAMSLTGPGSTGSSLAGATLGEGKLAVDVKVSDDRVSASTRVVQPLAGFRINPGATNPGGFTP